MFIVLFNHGISDTINKHSRPRRLKCANGKYDRGHKAEIIRAHLTAINAGNDFSLLGVKFDNNSYFTDSDIKNGLTAAGVSLGNLTPKTLAQKLGDGSTGSPSVVYKTPVLTTDAEDNDGDSFIAGSLAGSATVQGWYYDNGGIETALTPVQKTQSFCELAADNIVPYIKLEGPVTLSTEYGAPKSEVYDSSNANSPLHTSQGGAGKNPVRKLTPSGGAMACFAAPNLTYGTGSTVSALHPEWVVGKGFKVQNLGIPKSNFPRTGFHGAFFDLVLAGVSATDVVTNSESTSGTGIVTSTSGVSLKLTVAPNVTDKNVLRVELEGPRDATNGGAVNLPATFRLYGGAGNEVYNFELSKWFIARPGVFSYDGTGNAGGQTTPNYCASLTPTNKYRVPSVSEYTNANLSPEWTWGLPGWGNNNYARAIGNGAQKTVVSPAIDDGNSSTTPVTSKGGLFSEWGYTSKTSPGIYTSSDFESTYYWAVDSYSTSQYGIASYAGHVSYTLPSNTSRRAACVSP